MPVKSYREAINEAIAQEMRSDETVIVIGEDVAGGAGCEGDAGLLAEAFGIAGGGAGEDDEGDGGGEDEGDVFVGEEVDEGEPRGRIAG